MAINVEGPLTLSCVVDGENSRGTRRYNLNGDNAGDNFEAAYAALLAAVPADTPWGSSVYPFTWMFPQRATLERLRPDSARATVEFAAVGAAPGDGTFGVKFRFDTGSLSFATDKDAAGNALPPVNQVGRLSRQTAMVQLPALTFTLERCEPATGWARNSTTGGASVSGLQRDRVAAILGHVNSSNFMGYSGGNREWFFTGVNVQQWEYDEDYVRVAYHFAHALFELSPSFRPGWKVLCQDGNYYDVYPTADFGILGLRWPDGTLISS